ncbi:MAG: hypothetical protein ACI8RA_002012, partial [Chlamydiales bacterium]
GVMDYARIQNVQADTKMRDNLGEPPARPQDQ